MRTVEQLLQVKGSDIWSILPQATAYNALQIMAEKNVGALLVIEKEKLVGIFSERDYARKVILKDKIFQEYICWRTHDTGGILYQCQFYSRRKSGINDGQTHTSFTCHEK